MKRSLKTLRREFLICGARFVFFSTVCLAGVMLASPPAFSASKVIEIDVPYTITPTYVVGLLVSPGNTAEIKDVKFRKAGDSVLIVSVPYSAADAGENTFATAMVVDSTGKTVFGNVKPVNVPGIDKSFYSLPTCKTKITDRELQRALAVGDYGMFESLKDIRVQRRELLQTKLKRLMDEDFLKKHKALEQTFGFHYDRDLAPTMNPSEIVDRVSRMIAAIQDAKAHKKE